MALISFLMVYKGVRACLQMFTEVLLMLVYLPLCSSARGTRLCETATNAWPTFETCMYE